MNSTNQTAFGTLLRKWRGSRRLTQEQLAGEAEISTRHLSFLETGKAEPSREMVLLLASALELELRDRNVLLGAAGYAPRYRASPLEGLNMAPVRRALDLLLKQQEPYPAIVVDRMWNVLLMNRGAQCLLGRFLPSPPQDPLVLTNVLHALFAPDGLRPCVVNWEEVAAIIIEQMHREIALHPEDPERLAFRQTILSYPGVPEHLKQSSPIAPAEPFLPVHLRRGDDEVRLFTTITTLGTPLDVTAQELLIESYFPADAQSDAFLRRLASASP